MCFLHLDYLSLCCIDGYVYMLFGIVIGFFISGVHLLCMLPHNQFVIAGLVILPAALFFFPGMALVDVFSWAVAGGFLSAAIDLDVYVIVVLKSRDDKGLKKYVNPFEIYRNFGLFMNLIFETGLWRAALITHLIFSAVIIFVSYFYFNAYFVPAALAVATHLISDLPNFRRIAKQS